ncbi:MAG: hypothetical protein HKM94_06285 [Halobacteria archaeon]|nr:hypothetical protein [Halobacteria archaeon]
MDDSTLEEVVNVIEASHRSGQALLLFALAKTLDVPKTGHMYMLKKLQEMDAETRRLAYGLMELMAQQGNQGEEWSKAISRMETAIQGK